MTTHRWKDGEGVEWECSAPDHGPFCRLCERVEPADSPHRLSKVGAVPGVVPKVVVCTCGAVFDQSVTDLGANIEDFIRHRVRHMRFTEKPDEAHDWLPPGEAPSMLEWTRCQKCGVVLRRDEANRDRKCPGPVRVGMRLNSEKPDEAKPERLSDNELEAALGLLDAIHPGECHECAGRGTLRGERCGCGPGVAHVVDCGRPARTCPSCKGTGKKP